MHFNSGTHLAGGLFGGLAGGLLGGLAGGLLGRFLHTVDNRRVNRYRR